MAAMPIVFCVSWDCVKRSILPLIKTERYLHGEWATSCVFKTLLLYAILLANISFC